MSRFTEPVYPPAQQAVLDQAKDLYEVWRTHLKHHAWDEALATLDKMEQFWLGVELPECEAARSLALEVFIPADRLRTLQFKATVR